MPETGLRSGERRDSSHALEGRVARLRETLGRSSGGAAAKIGHPPWRLPSGGTWPAHRDGRAGARWRRTADKSSRAAENIVADANPAGAGAAALAFAPRRVIAAAWQGTGCRGRDSPDRARRRAARRRRWTDGGPCVHVDVHAASLAAQRTAAARIGVRQREIRIAGHKGRPRQLGADDGLVIPGPATHVRMRIA